MPNGENIEELSEPVIAIVGEQGSAPSIQQILTSAENSGAVFIASDGEVIAALVARSSEALFRKIVEDPDVIATHGEYLDLNNHILNNGKRVSRDPKIARERQFLGI